MVRLAIVVVGIWLVQSAAAGCAKTRQSETVHSRDKVIDEVCIVDTTVINKVLAKQAETNNIYNFLSGLQGLQEALKTGRFSAAVVNTIDGIYYPVAKKVMEDIFMTDPKLQACYDRLLSKPSECTVGTAVINKAIAEHYQQAGASIIDAVLNSHDGLQDALKTGRFSAAVVKQIEGFEIPEVKKLMKNIFKEEQACYDRLLKSRNFTIVFLAALVLLTTVSVGLRHGRRNHYTLASDSLELALSHDDARTGM